jgi:hypothetical protein
MKASMRKQRDELLDREIFNSLAEARVLIERWPRHYNTQCPHSSLGYSPPWSGARGYRPATLAVLGSAKPPDQRGGGCVDALTFNSDHQSGAAHDLGAPCTTCQGTTNQSNAMSKSECVSRTLGALRKRGFVTIKDLFSEATLIELRQRLDAQAAGERVRCVASFEVTKGESNQRIWGLAGKGDAFCRLALAPTLDAVMSEVLGEGYLLSSLSANIAMPGSSGGLLHRDQGFLDFWTPEPIVINVIVMLDDFSAENGATLVAPESHLNLLSVNAAEPVLGRAGDALIIDGRTLHATGANITNQARRAILIFYCRPYVRQQENFLASLDPLVIQRIGETFAERIGDRPWRSIGRRYDPANETSRSPGALEALGANWMPEADASATETDTQSVSAHTSCHQPEGT